MVTIDNIDSFVCVSASTNEDFFHTYNILKTGDRIVNELSAETILRFIRQGNIYILADEHHE